jgi:uncharacterized protein YqeY
MTYKDEINESLKRALKEKNALRVSVLRMLLSSVGYKEVEKRKPLTQEEFYGVVKTMMKQHVESIESFKKGQRQDLVEKEENELRILKEFEPAQMSEEEMAQEVDNVIETLEARDQKDMGRVMKVLVEKLASRADGKVLSQMVRNRLSSQRPS